MLRGLGLGAVLTLLLLLLLLLLLVSTGVPGAAKMPHMPSVLGRSFGGEPPKRTVLRGVAGLLAPETCDKLGRRRVTCTASPIRGFHFRP